MTQLTSRSHIQPCESDFKTYGLVLAYGHFKGEAVCTSDKSLTAEVKVSAHGVGIDIGVMKGEAHVGFWAKSKDDLIGTTAGVFVMGANIGLGPLNVIGIGVTFGAAPGQFMQPNTDWDLGPGASINSNDFGEMLNGHLSFELGGGADLGFIGLLVKQAE